jgi:hypothetical protein
LKKLRSKSYEGSDDEWAQLVSSVLDPSVQSPIDSLTNASLEVACSVSGKEPKRSLSVTLNNKVEEITQRLGTIGFAETQDTEDVDLFGWASQATEQRDSLRAQAATLEKVVHQRDKDVSSLQKQIDELVAAKLEHEKQMLAKFAMLLNEKKRRIRELEGIMSGVELPEEIREELRAALKKGATEARKNKRSAEGDGPDDEDDSDGFEPMQLDPPKDEQVDAESQASNDTTPTASDVEEDNESDDGGHGAESPDDRPSTTKNLPNLSKRNGASTRVDTPQIKAPSTADEDDEETASDDDEL